MIHLQLVSMLEVLSTVGTTPVLFFEQGGSCAPTLLIIPSAQKPGKMPHLTTRWRGQCHGLTSVFLPTRSVGHHLALRPIASHWVQARPDYPTRGSEAQAQAFH